MSRLSPNTTARRVIDYLVEQGVDTFFGIPGGPACAMFEAIRLNPKARLILTRHEASAGFMASTYYKASMKVPCVVVTSGPGITNAITGIANLYLEKIPSIVLAGDVSWQSSGRILAQDSGFQGINADALLTPLTVKHHRLVTSNGAIGKVADALDEARYGTRPGPSSVIVPLDVSYAICDDAAFLDVKFLGGSGPSASLSTEQCATIRTLFMEAKRPLIVIGHGCRNDASYAVDLAQHFGIPFVTTPRAKGFVNENHHLSLGTGGMAASIWARKYTEIEPDVCLVLGTDLDDTAVGSTKYVGPNTKLIHVDWEPSIHGRNYKTHIAIYAKILDVCLDLLECEPLLGTRHTLIEAKKHSRFDEPWFRTMDSDIICPDRAIHEIQTSFRNAVFFTDIGEHMLFALHYFVSEGEGDFNIQLELGSMGSGLCGAIGYAIARPDKQVVCVVGDGCMQMYGNEILTAVKYNLNIAFVVFNDGRYNMVHHGMKQLFGDAEEYDVPRVEFALWANAMGVKASLVVQHPNEFNIERIARMSEVAKQGPILLDVRIDPTTRIRGGGRVEALQQMSLSSKEAEGTLV